MRALYCNSAITSELSWESICTAFYNLRRSYSYTPRFCRYSATSGFDGNIRFQRRRSDSPYQMTFSITFGNGSFKTTLSPVKCERGPHKSSLKILSVKPQGNTAHVFLKWKPHGQKQRNKPYVPRGLRAHLSLCSLRKLHRCCLMASTRRPLSCERQVLRPDGLSWTPDLP